jgi:uncharacterized protein with GYD domain
MATYISLMRFTHQGVTNIKEAPARVDAGRKVLQQFGCELKEYFLTLGSYDVVAIIEAPDDAAIAKATLAIASKGNVGTETLRAFSEADYKGFVAELP